MKLFKVTLLLALFASTSAFANPQAFYQLDHNGNPIPVVAGPQLGMQPDNMANYSDCLQGNQQYGVLTQDQMMQQQRMLQGTQGTHYYRAQ